jgi:hypothetical protein
MGSISFTTEQASQHLLAKRGLVFSSIYLVKIMTKEVVSTLNELMDNPKRGKICEMKSLDLDL